MKYALVPHAGDWREAASFAMVWSSIIRLICRSVLAHGGSLPNRWGLLEVSNPTSLSRR